ncbi:MAG: hypothetical protein WCT30_09880 [Desulfurivibrionaceae bacterium]
MCSATSVAAEVSIGIWTPHVSIGINVPLYPQLVPVPGYPVYYAPRLHANYFFYDGMYWVYQDDNWYASSWYNGPWGIVEPYYVPLFILRVPVRYYLQPPGYFRGWHANAPPRWGHHWGPEWEQQRRGWDRWQHSSVPARAPLPTYQRQYSGERYPQVEKQHEIRSQQYRYQPREKAVREHFQQQLEQRAPAPAQREREEEPRNTKSRQQDDRDGKRSQPQYRGDENFQRSAPAQSPPQQRGPVIQEQRQQPGAVQREQKAPRSQDQDQRTQDREEDQGSNRGPGQGRDRDEERGRGRNY